MMTSLLRTLIFTLYLFSSLSLQSQLEFSAGVEMGVSSTQVSDDGVGGFDKFGISAGPFVRATWSETSSAKIEILYINKGSRKNPKPKINDFRTFVIKLNYIEIPLIYNYTYSEKLRGEAGIAIGNLISSSQVENDLEFDFARPFKNTEYSALFGVNYMFSETLFLNLRYSNSIIPIRTPNSTVNTLPLFQKGQYNSVLQLMVGYEF